MRNVLRKISRSLSLLRLMSNSRSGAVAPLTALLLVPLLGAMALAVDVGYWYKVQRNMQSAADSAALAAAQADNTSFDGMAKATAAQLGFADGTGDISVSSARQNADGTSVCPSGTGTCTQVTISNKVSLYFAPIVGILGNGSGKQGLSAVAVASAPSSGPSSLCITALGTTPSAITANGVPFANLAGCSMFSNGGMNCNGNNMGADYGIAVGQVLGCGVNQISGATAISDPYAALAANIPTAACQSSNDISGSKTWIGPIHFCGDVNVSANFTLQSGSNAVIVIDGTLKLNQNTFKTAANAGATLIFTGAKTTQPYPIAQNGGNPGATLDIAAPTSGNWSGVAIYQNPALTNVVPFKYAGNAPTWNITGLVYLPNADFTLSGAVGKATNGYSCFALVTKTITINGTGNMFSNPQSQCASAGLTPPSSGISGAQTWLLK